VKLTAYHLLAGFEESIDSIESGRVYTSNNSGASDSKIEDTIIFAEGIFCCRCNKEVKAVLVQGTRIYPHRHDLFSKRFYQCLVCFEHVGTHNNLFPLGVIPTPEIRLERQKIHAIIDPLWKNKKISRSLLYKKISDALGYEYHSANIRSVAEAKGILLIVNELNLSI